MTSKQISILFVAGVLINIGGQYLNEALGLTLFLDSIGTIMVAAMLGPWVGAGVGFISNFLTGLVINPVLIPFALVNMMIGVVVGFLARKRGFKDFLTPLYASLILTVLGPLMAVPIAVYLFGGITGGGLDKLYLSFLQSGNDVMSSAFLARIPMNFADKMISTYLIMGLIYIIPYRWRGLAEKGNNAE